MLVVQPDVIVAQKLFQILVRIVCSKSYSVDDVLLQLLNLLVCIQFTCNRPRTGQTIKWKLCD